MAKLNSDQLAFLAQHGISACQVSQQCQERMDAPRMAPCETMSSDCSNFQARAEWRRTRYAV